MAKTSHQGILPLVFGILAADTSPLGMTYPQVVEASGLDRRRCSSALRLLKLSGRCFSTGVHRFDRFFYATEARMEACKDAVAARLVVVRKQRKAEQSRKHRERLRAAAAAQAPEPKAAKPKREKAARKKAAPKVVAAKPAPVTIRKTPAQKWSDAEPIRPPGLKVTVCPGYVPLTFRPPPFFRGEYLTEWQQLRERAE